eukprot:m.85331 g.85331  ORF g.85331 m.85331 type:complete len:454 (+) comp9627_c0_seq2:520-1881(+)
MMDMFSTDAPPFPNTVANEGSVDSSTHVVPSDSRWNYAGMLSDPLLDSTELFRPPSDTATFDSLNDLFSVPTEECGLPKADGVSVLLSSGNDEQYWDASGWGTGAPANVASSSLNHMPTMLGSAAPAPAPALTGTAGTTTVEQHTSGPHSRPALAPMRLKLVRTDGGTDNWSIGDGNCRTTSQQSRSTNMCKSDARRTKSSDVKSARTKRKSHDIAASTNATTSSTLLSSSAVYTVDPTLFPPRRTKARHHEAVCRQGSDGVSDAAVLSPADLALPLPAAPAPAPPQHRGALHEFNGATSYGPQITASVAVASLVDARQLPLTVLRTVPVSVRRSLTAVDRYTRTDMSVVDPKAQPMFMDSFFASELGGHDHCTADTASSSHPLTPVHVPIFTKEIVSARAVMKPSPKRTAEEVTDLRRRRGMTPLKIVDPDTILRAAFTPQRSSWRQPGAQA